MTLDYYIFNFLNGLAGHSLWLDGLIIFFADFLIAFLPMIAVLSYFLVPRARKVRYGRALLSLILSLALAELVYLLIGLFYHRHRPFLVYRISDQLINITSSQSFPSNHTILGFVFSLNFWRVNRILGIIFVISALIIGLARVVGGVHYPSDVLGGILIALFSTWLIKEIMQK
ncbi:MAG: phosphatase PAP2 family protein [Patescibacteria group bacterium]|nr:phosphatase PAP2 family protein [Patescibacteria group bacterium]MDD5121320.1 phosphatase PAP2 family protein [Patescibacteria group bacterium]MDD5221805.1 phosphatase PAP2 family protein [Patescibacteria group bacterium]MDD5395761.1 phosphatase PAP2 family protein [Patescibacteria group bacterium]